MTSTNFTTVFSVDQTPDEAFAAITNVRGWWSGQIDGDTDKLGADFGYRYQDLHYSKQRITELVPDKKVVWRVLNAYLDFTEDPAEWNGTETTFELARKGDQTEVRFTHLGLVPEFECYDSCSTGGAATSVTGMDITVDSTWPNVPGCVAVASPSRSHNGPGKERSACSPPSSTRRS